MQNIFHVLLDVCASLFSKVSLILKYTVTIHLLVVALGWLIANSTNCRNRIEFVALRRYRVLSSNM